MMRNSVCIHTPYYFSIGIHNLDASICSDAEVGPSIDPECSTACEGLKSCMIRITIGSDVEHYVAIRIHNLQMSVISNEYMCTEWIAERCPVKEIFMSEMKGCSIGKNNENNISEFIDHNQ